MSSDAIPAEGVTLLTRDQFYPRGEIIVDNEDENFHLIDSANNRKRLADLIKKEDERQYGDFNIKANAWSLYLTQALHGEHIRSAFVKKPAQEHSKPNGSPISPKQESTKYLSIDLILSHLARMQAQPIIRE